jgi:copper resistance protein B
LPSAEANIVFQDVPRLALDAGWTAFEGGVRLRYAFKREAAPYVGVSSERVAAEPSRFSLVAGLRLWF